MSDIGRAGGPSPINSYPQSTDNNATTVQVGENNLSDVAKRLGVDPDDLQKANPQFSSTSALKTGQEISLPQNQSSQGPQQSRERDDDKATQPPSSRIGDPMVKDFIKSKLDSAGKEKDLSEKDLGQLSGGASAGKLQKDSFNKWEPTGSSSSGASADKFAKYAPGSEQTLGQMSGGASAGKTDKDYYYKPHGDDDLHSQKQLGEDHFKKTFDDSYKGTMNKDVIARDLSQTPGSGISGVSTASGKQEPVEGVDLNYGKVKVSYDS